MGDSNQRIQAMLSTATTKPGGTKMQSNPAMQNIASNGKQIIEKVTALTKSIANLTTTWGG